MAKLYWFLGHEQFQPEVLVRHAKLAEEAGFDGVMVSEHFHPWVDDVGAGGFAFSTLGAIAVTTKLALMTAVTTPLWRYHPALVAQAAATLDRLAEGRFSLGVGTGYTLNEGPLGYQFPAYAERAQRMQEALEIMSRLLGGEKLSFKGAFYSTDSAKLYSPPVGHVPIYLAAGGPKSAALGGSLADGVIISVKDPLDAIEKVIKPAQKAALVAGRPKPVVAVTHWTVRGQDDEEAWKALAAWRGLRAPDKMTAVDPATLRQQADGLPRDEVVARYTRVWTSKDYYHVYQSIIDALQPDVLGIQTTSLDQEATIRMMGQEVLPMLRPKH